MGVRGGGSRSSSSNTWPAHLLKYFKRVLWIAPSTWLKILNMVLLSGISFVDITLLLCLSNIALSTDILRAAALFDIRFLTFRELLMAAVIGLP